MPKKELWSMYGEMPQAHTAVHVAPANVTFEQNAQVETEELKQMRKEHKTLSDNIKTIADECEQLIADPAQQETLESKLAEGEAKKKELSDLNGRIRLAMLRQSGQGQFKAVVSPQPQQVVPGSPARGMRTVSGVLPRRTLKNFPNTVEGRMEAYAIGRFVAAVILHDADSIRWCNNYGMNYLGQQVESVNTAGGVWVPVEWSDRIIENRDSYGVYRANAFVETMVGDTKDVRRRKGGWIAKHKGERQASELQDPDIWDLVSLVAKKIDIYTTISDELSEDAVIGMADSMTSAAGEGLATREDLDGFMGDGTSEYGGIVGLFVKILQDSRVGAVKAAPGHNTMQDIDEADLTKLMGTLPIYAQQSPDCAWYMSGYSYQTVAGRIKWLAGGNTISDIEQGWMPNFAGYPVRLSAVLPGQGSFVDQGMIAFGDLNRAATLGDRAGIMFKQSNDFLFETDEIAVKWQERFDAVNHDLGDDQQAGAIVVLTGAA